MIYGTNTSFSTDSLAMPIPSQSINAVPILTAILTSSGFVHRPCLILKNQQGIYDTVAVYKSKKETEPIVSLKVQNGFQTFAAVSFTAS